MSDTNYKLYEKLFKLQWLLNRKRMADMMAHGPFGDTTRGQGRVLALLKIRSEISTKDLSYILCIRQQSLNELLNKMEKGGYVERKPSESDKRVMMIHLTEKGKNVQQSETDISDMFSCLNADEQAAFGEYLDRIISQMEEKIQTDPADARAGMMPPPPPPPMGGAPFPPFMPGMCRPGNPSEEM